MSFTLLDALEAKQILQEPLASGAVVLRRFAEPTAPALLRELQERVLTQAPFRHMLTPRGLRLSVAMSNCGTYGWVTDHLGYRYQAMDPNTQKSWPAMPEIGRQLAQDAAHAAGFINFIPDSCLINRYEVGARMALHQDKDEQDLTQPIVSVSLGMPAVFLFGGFNRTDRAARIHLLHGDVVVWGGDSRLRFHGVLAIKDNPHPLTQHVRINLTFRKARHLLKTI